MFWPLVLVFCHVWRSVGLLRTPDRLTGMNALKRQINACGNRAAGLEPDAKHQRTGKRQGRTCLKYNFLFRALRSTQGALVRL